MCVRREDVTPHVMLMTRAQCCSPPCPPKPPTPPSSVLQLSLTEDHVSQKIRRAAIISKRGIGDAYIPCHRHTGRQASGGYTDSCYYNPVGVKTMVCKEPSVA